MNGPSVCVLLSLSLSGATTFLFSTHQPPAHSAWSQYAHFPRQQSPSWISSPEGHRIQLDGPTSLDTPTPFREESSILPPMKQHNSNQRVPAAELSYGRGFRGNSSQTACLEMNLTHWGGAALILGSSISCPPLILRACYV